MAAATIKHCTLLFLQRDRQILLALKKRGFGAGKLNGVGGKIEPGETTEQALVRECQEEIEVTPTRFWKVAEHDFVQQTDKAPWHTHIHAYLCDQWEGEPVETEEMTPRWVNTDDIPYDLMWEDDVHWIPSILLGKHVYGSFTFDHNDSMLTHAIRETSFEA